MNGVRRLFGQAASGSATSTAIEQPLNITIPNYDQKSANDMNTTWSPQIPKSNTSGQRGPARTPSPSSAVNSNSNKYGTTSPSTSARAPSRQDSNPFVLDEIGTTSRSGSRIAKRKPSSALGHSKASSSLSRSIAYTSSSPPLPGSVPAASTKDELIIELLASEAVVDSRDCEILGTDQVEQLKKVCAQAAHL